MCYYLINTTTSEEHNMFVNAELPYNRTLAVVSVACVPVVFRKIFSDDLTLYSSTLPYMTLPPEHNEMEQVLSHFMRVKLAHANQDLHGYEDIYINPRMVLAVVEVESNGAKFNSIVFNTATDRRYSKVSDRPIGSCPATERIDISGNIDELLMDMSMIMGKKANNFLPTTPREDIHNLSANLADAKTIHVNKDNIVIVLNVGSEKYEKTSIDTRSPDGSAAQFWVADKVIAIEAQLIPC